MDVNERMAKARAARALGTRRTPVEIYLKDKKSLRKAVTAHCWTCSGGMKEEVRFCPVKTCMLWNVRPWQGKDDNGKDD